MDRQARFSAFLARLRAGGYGSNGRRNRAGTGTDSRSSVMVTKEYRGKSLGHMPHDVVAQHAQEQVSTHTIPSPMMDGSNVQVGIEATEHALHVFQPLIEEDHLRCWQLLTRDARSQHVEPVEGRFFRYPLLITLVGQGVLANLDPEVLADFVVVQNPTNP